MEVKVIDSLMGSGKTESMIKYMTNNKDKKFIYVTPYLDEVARIKHSCSELNFIEPTEYDIKYETSKKGSFKNLLKNYNNIVTTHALFENFDKEIEQLLEMSNYTLILDEVSQVVRQIGLSKADQNLLFHTAKVLKVCDNGKVVLDEGAEIYINDTRDSKTYSYFLSLINMVKLERIFMVDDHVLMWEFPIEIFKYFNSIYILTYLFEGQIQKYYFDIYNIKYDYLSIDLSYNLISYNKSIENEKIKLIRDKISIYSGKLNDIGNNEFSFSFNWYKELKKIPKDKIKNNCINYIQHIIKAKSKDIIWTTFKDYRNALKGKGYSRGFLSHNARATNDYREANVCIYLVNRFFNPYLKKYFTSKGIYIDEDMYALSEMVQWIWRSAIRDKNNINIYIPNIRMRSLFKNWLDNKLPE